MEWITGLMKELGIPAGLVLIGGLAFIFWRLLSKVRDMVRDIVPIVSEIQADTKELKEGKMWKETCEERHKAVTKTLDNHEDRIHALEAG